MFQSTLRGAVWFENIPQKSISSYRDLGDAFLETFQKMERHKRNDKEIHCAMKTKDESLEDFTKRFLTESRKVKGVSDVVKIAKFMNK